MPGTARDGDAALGFRRQAQQLLPPQPLPLGLPLERRFRSYCFLKPKSSLCTCRTAAEGRFQGAAPLRCDAFTVMRLPEGSCTVTMLASTRSGSEGNTKTA